MSGCANVPTLHLPHMKARKMTRQPLAMLQVAHQEGHYLGKLFKKHHPTPGEGKRGVAAKPVVITVQACTLLWVSQRAGARRDALCADIPDSVPPFKYTGYGSLAYIGHGAAVIDPIKSASVLGNIRCCALLHFFLGRHCTVLRPCWADHPRCVRRGWLMGLLWKSAEVFMQVCTFEAVAFSQIVHLNNNHSCFCVPLLITTCHAQISYKNMWLVSRDFLKTRLFGRDISDV